MDIIKLEKATPMVSLSDREDYFCPDCKNFLVRSSLVSIRCKNDKCENESYYIALSNITHPDIFKVFGPEKNTVIGSSSKLIINVDDQAIDIIKKLLSYLPDNPDHEDETWIYCWDELSDIAQDSVKKCRDEANQFIIDYEKKKD